LKKLGFNGLSAMAQATGFVAGAVAELIHRCEVPRHGVLGMHECDAENIIDTIRKTIPNQFCEVPLDFGEVENEENL
jgi:saccharopine dehydrogenase-like NADP-dependent oxidoreductase